ncbi:MAG: cation-transporting P-type ATPase, partial [Propionibacterium sp.]|nr:cation-transporting P-type ATPase [Propionibacterium sp.]
MNTLRQWWRGQWTVPIVSGLLIVVSWIVERVADTALSGRWWLDAGEHATSGESFMLSDALMVAAAVVAGYRIVVNAVRALTVKHISIDLLVSVAAIGATIIGNFWEA